MEWISVDDRLPAIDDPVLCFGEGYYFVGCRWGKESDESMWCWRSHTDHLTADTWTDKVWMEVTHWMPLPEPPKAIDPVADVPAASQIGFADAGSA